ncbi:MAG TPA: hypothetical protein VK277_14305 [Acidimicrobiales bacterium]|nr:hypothetical protein [Acidimicrobiales bacterium]
MRRRLLLLCPAALLALLAGGAPAGAVHATRVTGTYALVVTWESLPPADLTLKLKRTGTCTLKPWVQPHGNSCVWSEGAKGSFDMTLSNPALPTTTYTGVFTPTGLNTAASPGGASNTAGFTGTWYATRS